MKFIWNHIDNDVAIPINRIDALCIRQAEEWSLLYNKHGKYYVVAYYGDLHEIVFGAETKAECNVWIAECFADEKPARSATADKPVLISGRFLEDHQVTVQVDGKNYTRTVRYRKDCGLYIVISGKMLFEYEL